jgi:hypothetical protein
MDLEVILPAFRIHIIHSKRVADKCLKVKKLAGSKSGSATMTGYPPHIQLGSYSSSILTIHPLSLGAF